MSLQKLADSLEEKELSPETGISASDEFKYELAIDTFLQYGDTLNVISQVNTHGYQGKMSCSELLYIDLNWSTSVQLWQGHGLAMFASYRLLPTAYFLTTAHSSHCFACCLILCCYCSCCAPPMACSAQAGLSEAIACHVELPRLFSVLLCSTAAPLQFAFQDPPAVSRQNFCSVVMLCHLSQQVAFRPAASMPSGLCAKR